MEIKVSGFDFLKPFINWLVKDRRKPLPYSEVEIGKYTTANLAVAILAKIVLDEETIPDVESFLTRINIGRPYCPRCHRPLEETYASWLEDSVHKGYRCPACGAEHEGDWQSIFDNVTAQIRKDYYKYWSRYREKINQLTKGKPHKYKLKE